MLSLVHQFAPTCVFAVQVHKEVANRYQGGLTAASPSALALATASSLLVGGSSDEAAPHHNQYSAEQLGTLAFARDLFTDYAESQLQPALRQRWIKHLPALTRSEGSGSVEDLILSNPTSPTTNSNPAGPSSSVEANITNGNKLPREFVVPFDITPMPAAAGATTSSSASSFLSLLVTILDARVASHLHTAVARHQFVSLHHGKLMAVSEEAQKLILSSSRKDGGSGNNANEGEEEDAAALPPNASQFNFDDDLFGKIQQHIRKGSVPEDKNKCSAQYARELEEKKVTNVDGEDANNEDDDNANSKSGVTSATSKKRGRDADGSSSSGSSKRTPNPVLLSITGKGPFYAAIGDSVPALTAWIAMQVTYVGALSNDDQIPSPFAFALFKLLTLKLLPNEIVTLFATHKSNKYVRAVGVAAARYTFPPEELVPVLVPTLDEGAAAAAGVSDVAALAQPLATIAAAASATNQGDIVTSPTGDDVRSLALLVAEMAFDPFADVCELWFPTYKGSDKLLEALLLASSTAVKKTGGTTTNNKDAVAIANTIEKDGITIASLKLRLERYHQEIRKQKELLATVQQLKSPTASASGTSPAPEGGKSASSGAKEGGGKMAGGKKWGGGGAHGGITSAITRLDPRKLKELAERHQRLQEAKNLALIDEHDDAFDVESVSGDDEGDDDAEHDENAPTIRGNDHHHHHVNAFIGSGKYVAPSHMGDAAAFFGEDNTNDDGSGGNNKTSSGATGVISAAGGGRKKQGDNSAGAANNSASTAEQAAADEEGVFRRAMKAEARRARLLAVEYGTEFQSQANRVVLGMLGLSEAMRADDDMYVRF